MAAASPLEVARQLTERLSAGDVEGAAALYAEDAVVWRNFDARTLNRRQIEKILRLIAESVTDRRYEEVRVTPTPDGFVQQHRMRGKARGGEPIDVHTCLVVRVENGQIVRIDEYMDSAALAPLLR